MFLFQFSFLLFEMLSLFKSQCFNLFKYYARGNDFSKYVSTGINMLIKASSIKQILKIRKCYLYFILYILVFCPHSQNHILLLIFFKNLVHYFIIFVKNVWFFSHFVSVFCL